LVAIFFGISRSEEDDMPFNLKIMGIDGQRVTFMVDAEYRGQHINFNRSTFSMTPGETLTLVLNVNIPGYEDEVKEMEITPDIPVIDFPLLYKVEPVKS